MLLTAVVPRAPTILPLLFCICATTQDTEPGSGAIAQDSTSSSIFDLYRFSPERTSKFYKQLDKNYLESDLRQLGGLNPDGTESPEGGASGEHRRRRMLAAQYVLGYAGPTEEIKQYITEHASYQLQEVFLDALADTHCDTDLLFPHLPDTSAAREKRQHVQELRVQIKELLCSEIKRAVSVRTGEFLEGKFTADTKGDAFLHLLRRGKLDGANFYSELSALLADALSGGDHREVTQGFVRPLMDEVVTLFGMEAGHASRCVQIMRDSVKNIDKDLAKKMFNWERFSKYLMKEDAVKFIELMAEAKVDPYLVVLYTNDFYRERRSAVPDAMLDALTDYLKTRNEDGETFLEDITMYNDHALGKMPHELLHRLLDKHSLSIEDPEAAEDLRKRIRSVLAPNLCNTLRRAKGKGSLIAELGEKCHAPGSECTAVFEDWKERRGGERKLEELSL
ncbi:hypothetical protein PAPHI01_1412 [Pancytospora philotis]|nr:hypothetical protein PAPHI01_1412 [Pancytospora philotis]